MRRFFSNLGYYGVRVAIVALPFAIMGSCAVTAVRCWTRGGSVVKNVFDWPICVEVKRK